MNDTSVIVRIPQGCRPVACLVEKPGWFGLLMAAPELTSATLNEVTTAIGYLALRFQGESSDELPRVWFREDAFVPAPESEMR
jgi:hypothetical protein